MKAIYQGPLESIPSDDEYLEGAKKQLEASIQTALDDLEPRLKEGEAFVVINGVKFDARYIANLVFLLQLIRDGKRSCMELAGKISNQLWATSNFWCDMRLNLWRLGG